MALVDEVKEAIKRRAGYRCEYCRMAGWPLTVDHIIPRSAWAAAAREEREPPPFDPDEPGNIASACWDCNIIGKDDHTTGEDPATGEQVRLFHPRDDEWDTHFEWVENYTLVRGKTAIGRATIARLGINLPHYVAQRRRLRASTEGGHEIWP